MLRTDLTASKASANVTETESNPITILSAEKQAFAALFCKGIVRQATKQMHNLFAKNGSLHLSTTYARAFVRAFCFLAVLTPVMLRTNLIFNEK